MKRDLTDILVCPVHKTDLDLRVEDEKDGEILEGALHCGECGFDYPIVDGIPNLLPPEMQEEGGAAEA